MYGVALDARSRALVVRTPFGLWLPGGGTDGDAPIDALRRELHEETGYALGSARLLAVAHQYVENDDRRVFLLKQCTFYEIELDGPAGEPLERDHVAVWMPIDDAIDRLAEPASAWALGLVRDRAAALRARRPPAG